MNETKTDGTTSLDRLQVGSTAKIISVDPESPIIRRLAELGFFPGTDVECTMVSPLGDPVAYTVRGTLLALRRSDAKMIKIGT